MVERSAAICSSAAAALQGTVSNVSAYVGLTGTEKIALTFKNRHVYFGARLTAVNPSDTEPC